MTKNDIKSIVLDKAIKILTGENTNDKIYKNYFAGFCDTSTDLITHREQLFDASFGFNSNTGQLSFNVAINALKAIKIVYVKQINQ